MYFEYGFKKHQTSTYCVNFLRNDMLLDQQLLENKTKITKHKGFHEIFVLCNYHENWQSRMTGSLERVMHIDSRNFYPTQISCWSEMRPFVGAFECDTDTWFEDNSRFLIHLIVQIRNDNLSFWWLSSSKRVSRKVNENFTEALFWVHWKYKAIEKNSEAGIPRWKVLGTTLYCRGFELIIRIPDEKFLRGFFFLILCQNRKLTTFRSQ
jgi:hypothetical protein